MTQAQRIIKYAAIAFAVLLIFGIASGAVRLLSALFGSSDVKENVEKLDIDIPENIKNLDIDISAVNFEIKTGDSFRIETNSNNIKASCKKDTLKIEEKKLSLFRVNTVDEVLILYIPQDCVLESFDFDSGAGVVNIEYISAEEADIDLGAGKVSVKEISVTKKAEIDGGAGEIELQNGFFNDLEMNIGVGKLDFTAEIKNSADIDFGVGNADLTLTGNSSDYTFSVNKGIGSIDIDGEEVGNGKYGGGNVSIKLDGGVGNIKVSFKK